ncbi:MAG TPA: FMN-binding protein [Candidatus Brocadiia bacterium]|nr:FMN-binding protein [Candidatus Brocadiia bacterium]
MTKRVIHYAAVLGVICAAAALGVAATYYYTAVRGGDQAPIPSKLRQRQQAALQVLAGDGKIGEAVNPSAQPEDRVFKVLDAKTNAVRGYTASGKAQGYSSVIQLAVIVDAKVTKVMGMVVIAQGETPGLGTKIADMPLDTTWGEVLGGEKSAVGAIAAIYEPPKSLTQLPEFARQFQGEGVAIKDLRLASGPGAPGVQAISGATISSRAAVKAVAKAVAKIEDALKQPQTKAGGKSVQ